MLEEAITKVASLAIATVPKNTTQKLPGGVYSFNVETGEAKLLVADPVVRRPCKLGDLVSLRTWCEGASGDLIIGRRGQTIAVTPARALAQDRSEASVPFFDAFVPKAPMSLRAFTAWIDLLRPGLNPDDARAIDMCLQVVTVAEGQSQTVTQTGAAISVKFEGSKGLSSERPFPKRITALVPFGDPSFVTAVTFSLTLETKGTEILATAAVDELELGPDSSVNGPRDRFVAWARDQFAGLSGWSVMVAP